VGYIPFGQQQMTGLLKVPTKAQSCQDSRGHDFGISHLTLGILVMMKSFRHIVTQTKDRYNLSLHRFTRRRWFGFVTFQFTRNLWIFVPTHKVSTWVKYIYG
jgi:hypothetical protein